MKPSGADDRLGHQTALPFRVPDFTDYDRSLFTERFWYVGAAAPSGSPTFGAGLGYYPGRGVMDCYFSISHAGRQSAFQASTNIVNPALDPRIGPFRVEIPEPGRRHRLILEPNETGLEADLEFKSDWGFHDEGRETRHRDGKIFADLERYIQNGTWEGQIALDGHSFDIAHTESFGSRDRSWGVRVEADTDPTSRRISHFPKIFFAFLCAHFADRSIHFFFKQDNDGSFRFLGGDVYRSGDDKTRPACKIVGIGHDIVWSDDPYSQFVDSGTWSLELEDGTREDLSFKALPEKLFLKAGLYGGLKGWFQGDDKGPMHIQRSDWDFTDPEDRRECRTTAEQILEVHAGESVGYATLQSGVAPGHVRYPEIQDRPVM